MSILDFEKPDNRTKEYVMGEWKMVSRRQKGIYPLSSMEFIFEHRKTGQRIKVETDDCGSVEGNTDLAGEAIANSDYEELD